VPVYALGEHVPQIDPTAYVHPEAVVIGRVTVGAESTVWPGAVLAATAPASASGACRAGRRHPTTPRCSPRGVTTTIGHLAHLGCTIEDGSVTGMRPWCCRGRRLSRR
jgi:carbonic anhydrase/acetyltransferase-like protein (isoleucine patch superfamily)